jgi:hypothetical protein
MGIETAIIGSAILGAASSRSASKTQASAADRAADVQRSQFEQTREDQAPYRQAGYNALAEMQRTAGNVPGAFTYDNKNLPAAFKFGNYEFNADPGYGFRLSEGQKQLDRQAAIRGGQISGSALKAATRFGQDMGSQEFGNAYNRALTGYNAEVARENQLYGRALTGYNTGVASENQLYNRQAALAGIGQTSTNLVGQAGQNYATSAGNLMTGGAAAQAAGQVGMANAVTGGLGTYLNYSQNNALLEALRRNRGSTYGGSSLMSEPYPGYNSSIGLGPGGG